MSAIEAHDLFHLYSTPHGDVAALRGLSLTMADGEIVSVLGPTGAGKSTLLNLCAGFQRPSGGSLTVLGVPVAPATAARLDRLRRESIGIVDQHYHRALPPELTVGEIVELPLHLAGRRDAETRRRARATLRAAGLAGREAARPWELSGGEQQRVAVCAALAKAPRLLLADEPTGELDRAGSDGLVDLLLELLAESGAAALVVTHDHAVAARAERTIHLRDGRLSGEGAAKPVLVVDEQGWLRLPRRLREQAHIGAHVRASAENDRIELRAEQGIGPGHAPRASRRPAPDGAERRAGADVVLDRVTKRYGSGATARTVVRALSTTFPAQKLHAIVGPSGAGKTTLLDLIAVLDRPDDGEVRVAGERVDRLSAPDAAAWRQRTVGYVSQHATLVDFLSARENVEFVLDARGIDLPEQRERAAFWLAWAGLADLAERRADRLSGGERRLVAVVRALAPGPPLLLADEPTAQLDRPHGRLVLRLLEAAVELGTTVVAAGHDPDLAAAADRCLRLDEAAEASKAAPVPESKLPG